MEMDFAKLLMCVVFVCGVSAQEVTTSCDHDITNLTNGELQTPDFPNTTVTVKTMTCKWKVTLPPAKRCTNVVGFVIDMEGVNNETKKSTHLTIIINEKATLLNITIKNGRSEIFYGNSRTLHLTYVTTSSKSNYTKGYAVKLNFFSSGSFTANSNGSTGVFQLTEEDVAQCNATWSIKKPAGNNDIMSLRLYEDVQLPNRTIGIDKILKGGNSTKIASLASSIDYPSTFFMDGDTDVTYTSTPPLTMINKNKVVFSGFYILLPKDSSCSLQFNTSAGVLTSPLYPDLYPENAYCISNIADPKPDKLHLIFTSFELAHGHSLVFKVKNKTIVSYNSKSEISSDVIADGPLDVTFSSSSKGSVINNINVAPGFKVHFQRIVCGGTIIKATGEVMTPKAVPAGTMCVWIITIPPPKDITTANNIKYTYFANSQSGGLEIKDGALNSSQSVSFQFTKDKESQPMYSRTNQLWIKYTASNKAQGSQFHLKFSSNECDKNSQCGNSKMCMHPDWHCNGVDDCGDMSDERNCGYAGWILAVAVVAAIIGTVILMFVVAFIIKKYRKRDGDMTGLVSHADE